MAGAGGVRDEHDELLEALDGIREELTRMVEALQHLAETMKSGASSSGPGRLG
jgi:hypothetical protein